jgi:hypothetical protein
MSQRPIDFADFIGILRLRLGRRKAALSSVADGMILRLAIMWRDIPFWSIFISPADITRA